MCHVWRVGRGAQRILEGTPEGKRPFERPRRKWEHNIFINLERNKMGKREGSG
jgi:hypothetical protein